MAIPKKIYFIFGMKKDFGNKPFCYSNYLNILSAHQVNPDYDIEVIYKYEPDNKYFKDLDAFCKKVKIDNIPIELNGQPVNCVEHISGYVRINKLYEEGGVYLDSDVICVKPFDDLLDKQCILGTEWQSPKAEKSCGVSDAIILAEKNSLFLRRWIEDYNVAYKNEWYAYNACTRPFELSKQFPSEIDILPVESFCKYSWHTEGFNSLFEVDSNLDAAYTLHLFSSMNYKHLKLYDNLNHEVWQNNSTVTNIYRKLIENTKF